VASPSFALTEGNRPVVAEICRLVDCLPLTVELSAAHSESYAPEELLQRLAGQRLALLARGGDGGPARHRSLADALWRSYQLLAPAQQRLLRALSLCAGGIDLASIRDLGWAPDDEWKALAAKFLVRALNEAAGEWLAMLETVRAFALERLQHAGEETSTHRAYGVHFLALARRAADGAGRTGAAARFARLERNNENLRSVLRWCVVHDPALGRQLAAALTPFWYHRGYATEGARWLAELMAVSGAEGTTAEMYYSYAHMLHQAGELATADAQIQLALAAAQVAGDDGWLAKVHHEAGWIAYNRVERRQAAGHFQAAIRCAVAVGDEAMVADSQVSLAFVYGALGEQDAESLALLEQGVARYQRLELPAGSAFAVFNLGSYHVRHGDYGAARAAFYQAMAQFRALGDRRNLAWLLEAAGETELLLGNDTAAQVLAEESLTMFRESGERWGEGLVLTHLGHIALLQGAMAVAAAQFAAALELFVHLPNEYMVAMTAADLGGVAILSGRAALGWPLFCQAEVAVLQVEDLRRAFVTERLARYRSAAERQLSSLPEPGLKMPAAIPASDLAVHAMRVAAQLLAEL
jgi:tetratricopeptide (TPR) repeat protein